MSILLEEAVAIGIGVSIEREDGRVDQDVAIQAPALPRVATASCLYLYH
jgi:hypothetical protein